MNIKKELLKYEQAPTLEKVKQLIKNEKKAFNQLFWLRLTNKMITLVSWIGYWSLVHLDLVSELTLRKYLEILRNCDFGDLVAQKYKK